MIITPKYLFAAATPYVDPQPWRKAFSYSAGTHAALWLLLALLAINRDPIMKTVLTEINFVERAPVVEKVVKKGSSSKPAKVKTRSAVRAVPKDSKKGKSLDIRGTGSKRKSSGKTKLPPTKMSSPRGTKKGEAVLSKPIVGPIIALEELGNVGRRKGTIRELAGATKGPIASGLAIPGGGDSRPKKLIALGKINLDAIRKRETSIGTPLVSQNVVVGSLGGRSRSLAGGSWGWKKKAKEEDLKANPYDKHKWGKHKGPFSMEGPLKYRKILKLELPPYPRWAEERALQATVSIRLWVNPKGLVKDNMYFEKTTGYSELDHLAMEALRRFKFVPLPKDHPQEDEWGVATFRYELKK